MEFSTKKFILSVTYGCNEGGDRKRLWSHLISVYKSGMNEPWLLASDFNIIARSSESSPFNASQAISNDMKDFEDARNHIFVYDHAFSGLVILGLISIMKGLWLGNLIVF